MEFDMVSSHNDILETGSESLERKEHTSLMSLDVFKLDGRVALITGGNRGLGFAMAQALAEAGANVVVTSRQEDRAMKSAATLATITGKRTLGIAVDITDAEQNLLKSWMRPVGTWFKIPI